MSGIAESQDLVPLIFGFLPPSAYFHCSLVSSLWELSSRRHIYQHITALDGITFSQCIALFTGKHNLAQYVRSCCFYYSIPASAYIDENFSLFIQYILSTCDNLTALTFWDVPLDGEAFALLHKHSPVRVLTFQNCTWDDGALSSLLSTCSNTTLLQFSNTIPLFRDDRAYHRAHIHRWTSRWRNEVHKLSKPRPVSLLLQSPQDELSDTFWQLINVALDKSDLIHLKILPHPNNAEHAKSLIVSCLPNVTHLETTILQPLPLGTANRLTHVRLNTLWGSRNLTQPTLTSLPQSGCLTNLVLVLHVGVVVDEIMRTVMAVLEDLQHKHITNITFLFRRLSRTSVPTPSLQILPNVLDMMTEHLPKGTVVKADWIGTASV